MILHAENETKIILENETVAIKSEINEDIGIFKLPRGLMVRVDNITFWEKCLQCLESIPSATFGIRQLWFTAGHNHDPGAIVNGENILVNLNNTVGDDRGIDKILFSPGNYIGTETVEIQFI